MGRNRKKPVRRRLEKRQKRSRQKKKSGLFDKVTMVILVVAVCVFAFSLYQLVRTMVPYYSGGKEYDKLKNKAITVQEQTDDPGDVSGDTFKVDFDVLLQENPDTVAWIRFDEPSIISYPVVKSADNKEYLTKTFSANDNKLGAIFMDMKNKSDFSDMLDCSYFQFHSVHHLWIDYNSLTDVAIRFLYYSLSPFVTPPLEVV